MRLYLDTCCLNRPWDDQSQVQVHLEAEAVLYIIDEARRGRVELTTSDYLLAEIHENPDLQRMTDVLELILPAVVHVPQSPRIDSQAEEFAVFNIRGYDALHLAAAEAAKADCLLTTDHRFFNRAQRAGNRIKVAVLNPVNWPTAYLNS